MAIKIGHHLAWRFQGLRSCCWLTCIEMVMQYKHGSIYGNNADHSPEAKASYQRNKGDEITVHAGYYGLKSNLRLSPPSNLTDWSNALSHGPVIAEGNYGWSRLGVGSHVIVVVGISNQDKIAYFNPNLFAVLPHPQSKLSYMTLDRLLELSHSTGMPFWQCEEDMV